MARPVRVLHVITRLILGGAQENTLITAIGQNRAGMDVTLLAGIDPGPEGNLHQEARDAGLALELMPRLVRPIRPFNDLLALLQLYRYMRRGEFDIVHTHSSKAGILGRIAARWARVPIVVHTLHSLVFHDYQSRFKNGVYVALKKRCAPLADALIAVNQKTIDGAIAAGIGRPDQYVKIFSGMELAPFLEARGRWTPSEARKSLGIPGDAPVVGKVARLFPLKGHDAFLDAIEAIARREPRCFFLIVGDGVLRDDLEARIARMGLDDRTVFTGLVSPEDVPRHIQAMDVVVHTSLREGIARVLPQAGAVGKPVVCFDLDGAPEVIEQGGSGYLVPPRDTKAMAERVLELLADPKARARMGEAGRAFAAEHYPAERMVEKVNAVYRRFADRLSQRGAGTIPEPRDETEPRAPFRLGAGARAGRAPS